LAENQKRRTDFNEIIHSKSVLGLKVAGVFKGYMRKHVYGLCESGLEMDQYCGKSGLFGKMSGSIAYLILMKIITF
jgi:hypothetical protein